MKKIIGFIAASVVVVLLIGAYLSFSKAENQKADEIDGIAVTAPAPAPHFVLQDQDGKLFSNDQLKHHWTMMFFGFTNCGMVCPTTMAALNEMYQKLEKELPKDQLPNVVMISVDPARDTVFRMKEYVTAFNAHFIGLRGNQGDTKKLENALHIAAEKQTASNRPDQYMMNHTAEILVFNPNGKLQAYFSYPHEAKQMAHDYHVLLAHWND